MWRIGLQTEFDPAFQAIQKWALRSKQSALTWKKGDWRSGIFVSKTKGDLTRKKSADQNHNDNNSLAFRDSVKVDED